MNTRFLTWQGILSAADRMQIQVPTDLREGKPESLLGLELVAEEKPAGLVFGTADPRERQVVIRELYVQPGFRTTKAVLCLLEGCRSEADRLGYTNLAWRYTVKTEMEDDSRDPWMCMAGLLSDTRVSSRILCRHFRWSSGVFSSHARVRRCTEPFMRSWGIAVESLEALPGYRERILRYEEERPEIRQLSPLEGGPWDRESSVFFSDVESGTLLGWCMNRRLSGDDVEIARCLMLHPPGFREMGSYCLGYMVLRLEAQFSHLCCTVRADNQPMLSLLKAMTGDEIGESVDKVLVWTWDRLQNISLPM